MKRNFFDSEQFASLLILFVAVSLGVSGVTGEWTWFARSGSILVLGGLVLSGRAIIRNGTWDDILAELDEAKAVGIQQREQRERGYDLIHAKLGMFFAGVGTVIWGYGDLLGAMTRL